MAVLLNEYDEAFPNQPNLGTRVLVTQGKKLVKIPKWLLNYRHPDMAEIDKLRPRKEETDATVPAESGD
jgi:hypothetical protein